MPCRYDPTPEEEARAAEAACERQMKPELERRQKLLDEATRAACEALTFIEKSHTPVTKGTGISKDTGKWWTDHKKRDEVRIAREKEQATKAAQAKRKQKTTRAQLVKLLQSDAAGSIPQQQLDQMLKSAKVVK